MESPRLTGPMRDLFRALPVFIGMALLVTILAMIPGRANNAASAQTPTDPQAYPRTVSVSGTGNVQAEPDMAVVVLGVQTEAATAREALNANNEQMDALIAALRSAGVAQADIRTLSVQLYPRYDDRPTPLPPDQPTVPTPTPTGTAQQPTTPARVPQYVASNTVEVTVRDLARLGQTIDDAVTAGGNTIQGIRFDISNQTTLLDQAREAAMEDARRKAEQLADLAGAELGVVITISEFSRTPVVYEAAAAMDMAQGGSVPVTPGTQTVTLDVQVVWELQ